MKNLLYIFALGISISTFAQPQFNNFEESQNLDIQFDTLNMDSLWQIGPPQKVFFDAAFSLPNVLVTDTINTYPVNSNSSFIVVVGAETMWDFPYIQLEWKQKTDLELGVDGGIVEASYDEGQTWQNILNDTIYRPSIVGHYEWEILANGQAGFTGTLDWFWIGVCWGTPAVGQHPPNLENILMRFTMYSDSVDTAQEGWMIDDMYTATDIIGVASSVKNISPIRVYPNPVDEALFMDLQSIESGDALIQVFNPSGQEVFRKRQYLNAMEQHRISVAHLPKGIYFLNLQTETGLFQQKFVKLE